ncbi:hypothetical protein Nps_03075 [Candidatus Nanopusillus acidilobi]|nr:hypothetical protein Nps_03075 [Candidatus Nanopusillus acidilobi]
MKLLKIFIFGLMVILIPRFVYSQGWYAVTITNNQNMPTPAPFQQDIAICNGNVNIGPNFAYINNAALFNEINPNGQNVYFVNSSGNILYSWYEGQLNYNGVYCDIWWINLSNGIPANSKITIYMAIGSYNTNYYSQYYPYVGTNEQVIGTMQYDNGQDVFIVYGYFDNTFDGWSGYVTSAAWSPTATSNGIEMINDGQYGGTYILPPNNWNIPKIPLIVEEAWYNNGGADANVIALFGNTSQQIYARNIGSTYGGDTPASSSSTFAQFEYYIGASQPSSEAAMLKSAVTDQYLDYTYFPPNGGTVYSYLIVNSSYAQTGYYIYNSLYQVWVPLTLLDTYTYNVYNTTNINNGISGYTYAGLNYNPFQYGTLEIGAGDGTGDISTDQYVEWVVARSYPPNGIMPSISIQPVVSVSSVQLNPSSSSPVCPGTQTNSTVTVNLNNPYELSTTVNFYCSAPSGITCSLNPSCTTSGSSCSATLYVNSFIQLPSGWYPIFITNTQSIPTPAPFQQDIAICNGNINIGPNFAYIDNATLFNLININGSNVYFATPYNSTPNIYSWYEGQLNYNGVYCDIWWINLPNGIPANSKITIYMYIGPNNANYYSQYYPYVGTPIQVLGISQYDNGNYVFNYYQNFGGLSSLPSGWTYICGNQKNVSFSTDYTIILPLSSNHGNDGITTTNNYNLQNNVVDIYASVPNYNTNTGYQWMVLGVGAANIPNTYFMGPGGGIIAGGNNDGAAFSGGGTGVFSLVVGTSSSLGSVNYSYVPTMYSIGFSSSNTYFLVNYTQVLSTTIIPGSFSLPITIGQQEDGGNIYLYWVLLRSLPPNDVMPSISISLSALTPGSYSVTVTASIPGSSASSTYTYNVGQQISISSQQSSNFQNSYNIYITGCSQNYTLYVNNSPYCYDSYYQFQNINALCIVSYLGSYSVYAQGCYNGNCVNSNTINLNIPSSGITVPIIDINILNATNQNINTTISVNGSNQNIQSINVYYNNNNVYSNNNLNTNYYSFNLSLPYSNNGNITVCSALTNGQFNCILQLLYFNIIKIVTYYGIIVG